MRNRTTGHTIFAVLWLCASSLNSSCYADSDDAPKPGNYDEIKPLLESYASAIDNYSGQPDGEKILLAKGDEETLALIALLKTRHFPQEKSRLVTILAHNRAVDKKNSARLLVQQLPENVEKWDGQWWIVETIRFLTDVDPDLARIVALKGLDGPDSATTYAAVKSLGTVGKMSDLNALESFRERRNSHLAEKAITMDTKTEAFSVIIAEAESEISKRNLSAK